MMAPLEEYGQHMITLRLFSLGADIDHNGRKDLQALRWFPQPASTMTVPSQPRPTTCRSLFGSMLVIEYDHMSATGRCQ